MALSADRIKHWVEVASWVVAVGTVVVTAWAWLLDSDNRTKASHYQAWSVINSAAGATGDGGRRIALPAWKMFDVFRDALPARDRAGASDDGTSTTPVDQ